MGGSANVVKNTKAFTVGRPILKTTDAFGKTLGSGNNADPYAANLVLAIPMNGTNNGTTFRRKQRHSWQWKRNQSLAQTQSVHAVKFLR